MNISFYLHDKFFLPLALFRVDFGKADCALLTAFPRALANLYGGGVTVADFDCTLFCLLLLFFSLCPFL